MDTFLQTNIPFHFFRGELDWSDLGLSDTELDNQCFVYKEQDSIIYTSGNIIIYFSSAEEQIF